MSEFLKHLDTSENDGNSNLSTFLQLIGGIGDVNITILFLSNNARHLP